jgi:[ribosomal protein S18]-alanine N-acetyltransferase
MSLSFRTMRENDLDAVYEIEVASFSEPWTKELFAMELQHNAYVAEQDSRVAGYICTWCVLDECTITNIAVKPDLKRQGIAKFMFENLYENMDKQDIRFYYLEVRASNTPALALYEKLGYAHVGLRKGYYHNPIEDAIVMTLDKQQAGRPAHERF